MPKKSKHPRFRTHVKSGKGGQRWCSYWFDMRGTGKPDVPLGTDYEAAILRWSELAGGASRIAGTLEEAFARWEAEALAQIASAETRRDYTKCLRQLRPVFGPATWASVRLPVLKAYLARRSAKTRANREISVLQIVWNWARGEDLTTLQWPATGLERSRWKNREKARDVDVTDAMFAAVHKHADAVLRDALDIASATGLRVRDVRGLRLSDVRDGKLVVTASKTGKRAEFDLCESDVLPQIIARRRASKALHIYLLDANGRQPSERMLHDRFVKARAAAALELPECAGLLLRDMRRRAAQLSASLADASSLLQHSSPAVTRAHYRRSDKLRPVR